MVENLSKTIDGVKVLDNISFTLGHDDKVAFVGANEQAITTFFRILMGELEPDEGNYKWGVTTSQAYFPKDSTQEFDNDLTITDWLTQYSEIKDATYVRGFLGRMLFPGEDGVKRVKVLSGGEKVRCLLSKMMISGANTLFWTSLPTIWISLPKKFWNRHSTNTRAPSCTYPTTVISSIRLPPGFWSWSTRPLSTISETMTIIWRKKEELTAAYAAPITAENPVVLSTSQEAPSDSKLSWQEQKRTAGKRAETQK